MAQITHKRGDTFSLNIQWVDSEGLPISLSGFTVASQVRAENFVDNLTVTIVDSSAGLFTLSATATATASWPVTDSSLSRTFCDVQFTASPFVTSSETFQIVVVRDITQ